MPELPLEPFRNTPYSDPLFGGVSLPEADPGDEPLVCFNYNEEYHAIISALLSRLTRRDAWKGGELEQKLGVQKGNELLAILQKAECPEGIEDGLCTEYSPLNPFTTYFPLSPYVDTEYIPPGYQRRPFYTNVTNILLDIQPSDVICDILALDPLASLPELLGFDWPLIHIDLEGAGKAELHFLQLPQGGFCTVTIDGNPFQAKVVNLNSLALTDIESILGALGVIFGGGLAQRFTHELEFTTSGEHTIDITFFPHIGGDVILGFGGGFAGMEFCSSTIDGDMRYMPITDMRVNQTTCKWEAEYNNDGMWVEIGDYYIPACVPEPAAQTLIQDPGNGQLQQSLDGGLNYDPIPNAHFLHINADNDPLTGELESRPASTSQNGIVIRLPAGSTAKALLVRDTAGVDQTFINPDGTAQISGTTLLAGLRLNHTGLRFDNGERLFWADPGGVGSTVLFGSGAAVVMRTLGGGYIWQTKAAQNLLTLSEAGLLSLRNAIPASGKTQMIIQAGAGNIASDELLTIVDAAANNLIRAFANGQLRTNYRDAATNTVSPALIANHTTSGTPAAGFGSAVELQARSTTTDNIAVGTLGAEWVDATHASRKSAVKLLAYDTNPREILRGGTNGSAPTLAVLGQTPSPRVDVGTLDCMGNAAVKAALDALKTFGWIEGTINLGEVFDPGSDTNTGVVVPTLPAINTLTDNQICSIAVYLAEIIGEWLSWHIVVSDYAVTTRDAIDIFNYDGFTDAELGEFVSNFKFPYVPDLVAEKNWWESHNEVASQHTPGDGVTYAQQDVVKNAIYAATVSSASFDDNWRSLIQQNIGFINDELSDLAADGMGTIPLWYWQRWAYVAMQGAETGCETLPEQEWGHTEQWVTDNWIGVTQTDGTWVFNVGYSTNAPGGLNRLEIPYSLLSFTLTYSIGHGSGTPPSPPNLVIEDIATGEIDTITHPDYGNYQHDWSASIFPQGSEGVYISIQGSGNTTSAFKVFAVAGYGTEIPN